MPCRYSAASASGVPSPCCSSTESLSCRRHSCGNAAISRASCSAARRASPGGTSRLASPMSYASEAGTGRPVRIMSMARLSPIRRGSRTVPPSTRGTPQRLQNTPKTASCSATLRSHQSASSSPPATACPETAAMTGLVSRIRVGPIGPSPSASALLLRSVPMPLRSAPAQKVPPSPHRTATDASLSASNRRKASASPSAVGPSTALRTSGRLSTTVKTGPSRSIRTAGLSSIDPLSWHLDRPGRADAFDRLPSLHPSGDAW